MKSDYVQAFLEVLQAGMPVDTALKGLEATLKRKNHSKLYASVLLEVMRVLEADKAGTTASVAVATSAQAKELKKQISDALAALGVDKNTVVKEIVDETLVGGFVATFDYKEHDQSYKKSLKNLFESITK
jgi:F0F1-type ATP synthase delta subunit